jgi:hypothetical protein
MNKKYKCDMCGMEFENVLRYNLLLADRNCVLQNDICLDKDICEKCGMIIKNKFKFVD